MQLTITVDGVEATKSLSEGEALGLTAQAAAEGNVGHAQFILGRVGQVLTSYGQQAKDEQLAALTAAFNAAPAELKAEWAAKVLEAQANNFQTP